MRNVFNLKRRRFALAGSPPDRHHVEGTVGDSADNCATLRMEIRYRRKSVDFFIAFLSLRRYHFDFDDLQSGWAAGMREGPSAVQD